MLSGPYTASVERVVDGDTLAVRVTVWLQQEVHVLVRLRGIDAPELRGDCDLERIRAAEAAAALQHLVAAGAVQLTEIEGDKYHGRVIADVTTEAGDVGEGARRPGIRAQLRRRRAARLVRGGICELRFAGGRSLERPKRRSCEPSFGTGRTPSEGQAAISGETTGVGVNQQVSQLYHSCFISAAKPLSHFLASIEKLILSTGEM
jgi:hypothetical protein